ncbi:MAG: glycosyltransferase family 1 protein [Calditrichaeota bacterium]|nr:MAG: glycosyltransferase family 1 protein [Calditrichota bacterium]
MRSTAISAGCNWPGPGRNDTMPSAKGMVKAMEEAGRETARGWRGGEPTPAGPLAVAFMNSIGPTSWGGGEQWMLTCGCLLRQRGHQIYYIGRAGSRFLERCRQAGFPVLGLEIGSDFGPANILRLARFFRENHVQVLIANFNKDVRLGGLAARYAGVPRVLARNGLPIVQNNWRYRLSYRFFTHGIITNTAAIKQRYLSYGWLSPSFIHVIPNGIDIDQPVEFPRNEVLEQFGLPDRRPIIGTFGRLVKQKQHHIFLEVAAALLKEWPEALFLIVGDGPLRQSLQQYAFDLGILDSIYFLGFQNNVMPLYSICDLVTLTSEEEGQPNTVLEAMLAGKAVVAFNVGGVSELLATPEVGRLVPPNDIFRMTQAIQELLLDEDTRENMGRCARRFVQEHFSLDQMIERLEALLIEEVGQATGGTHGA